ncbi:SDR family oxidoreductase [Patescibacteria group bacterium]|nr:SDR family oxidoreductase [Patescibacteria group bacterium]
MKKQKILITGMSGLLGSTLEQILKKEGHDIYDIDMDISDTDAVKDCVFRKENFDWIIHTAAVTNVDSCEKDRFLCYNVNAQGTKNIRDLAETIGAKLIYISTASVFSGEEGNYKETDLPYPRNFYNLTKFLGEQVILEYNLGLVLRLNLIGIHPKGSRGLNFFEWLVNSIKANKNIQLFNDIMINPLSSWTIAEFINNLIEISPQEKILHLASKNILSKADIGKLVIKKLGNYRGKARFVTRDDNQSNALRPKQMWLNADYAQTKLGLEMPTLESEIEKILKKSHLL